MGKVVLLTGAPSTGKSTLRQELERRIPALASFDYGELLRREKEKAGITFSYTELREQSSELIQPTDVSKLDGEVIDEVSRLRSSRHVLIDSHAVTRESYGFRAIPFSVAQLMRLAFDAVLVTRLNPESMIARIELDPQGRRAVTPILAAEHQAMQEAVALNYAITCGCPIFVFDGEGVTPDQVGDTVAGVLTKLGMN